MPFVLAAVLTVGAAIADTVRTPADTARVFNAPAVVVTATRSSIPISDSPSPVQVISAADFDRLNGTTVADVLRSAQGVFLNDYGASGQLKSVNVRGLSSENVLVLLNGTRLNNMQNGLVDFSLLPLDNLARIEIVRGGSSAFFGGDALGGVVNLITRTPGEGFRGRAEAGLGSFGFDRVGFELSQGMTDVGLTGGYTREQGRDGYPFILRRPGAADTAMTRSNADFRRTNAYVSANASLGFGTSIDCSLQRVTAQRGVPGSLDLPSLARQDDDNIQMTLVARHAASDGLALSVNGAVQYSFQSYNDPDPFFPFASRYRNLQYTVNPEVQAVVTPWYRLLAGAEYGHGILDGNDFSAIARREQYSVFVSNEWLLERTAETFDRTTVVLAGRYQTISDVNASAPFGDRIFFKAGLNVRVWKAYDLRLRASLGTNFRVPTFNDLYYPGFSNPDLKPERSRTMEAGLTSTLASAVMHQLDVTAFSIDTRERILFDPVRSRPENIGRVQSRGMEVQYRLTTRDESVQLLANASFTEAVKKNRSGPVDATYERQLPYVPTTAGSLAIALGEERLRVSVIQTYGGRRFTSLVNAPSLPPFARTDVNAAWTTDLDEVRIRLRAECSNLFDSDYQVYDGYPMPGRSFRASIVIEF